MKRHKNEAELYLATYPGLRKKWINQCVACQRQGYKPEMPERIYAAENIRSFFEPLELDEYGLCDLCAESFKS